MDDFFKIYIEQLRNGKEEQINEQFDPSFLDVSETDLVFDRTIDLEGQAYLAEHELVLHWNIYTEALITCSICNEWVRVPIKILNFYYSVPVSEIKTGIYNYKNLLRETILLETPSFAECKGKCPTRKDYHKYLKETSQSPNEEEGYKPFADLDWKNK